MAPRLSSTGISHHSLLPHIPSIHLSAVNSSPHPGITPHSPNSSSQPLHLPGDPCPSLGYVWLCKDPLILIAFRLPQISCFTLGLKCFSLTQTIAPVWGLAPASVQLKAGPILLTLLFFSPSSFILWSFAWFYIFFSAGQVLLSILSWCSARTSVSEDVSMEREVLHIHLLLHHLVPPPMFTFCYFYFSGVGCLVGHITNYLSLNNFSPGPNQAPLPGPPIIIQSLLTLDISPLTL